MSSFLDEEMRTGELGYCKQVAVSDSVISGCHFGPTAFPTMILSYTGFLFSGKEKVI
jgi:hypothetical protein